MKREEKIFFKIFGPPESFMILALLLTAYYFSGYLLTSLSEKILVFEAGPFEYFFNILSGAASILGYFFFKLGSGSNSGFAVSSVIFIVFTIARIFFYAPSRKQK